MLTINIPQSTSQKSAEDQLAEYILTSLRDRKEAHFSYFHSGCATGKWVAETHTVYSNHCGFIDASLQIISSVLSTFENAGYLVNKNVTGATWTNVRIS